MNDKDNNQLFSDNEFNKTNITYPNNNINSTICPRCGFVGGTILCGHCGLDLSLALNFNNNIPLGMNGRNLVKQKDRKLTMLIIMSVIIGCMIMILLFFFTGNMINKILNNPYLGGMNNDILTPDSEYYDSRGVSEKEYYSIGIGMSYAFISSVIGSDGKIVDQGKNLYGRTYYTYLWTGEEKSQATVYIKFIDSEAVEIVEDGLIS